MKIPKTIKIGATNYKIREKMWLFDHEAKAGNIVYGRGRLNIRSNLLPRTKQEVFFHEISHGILKELEFNHPKIVSFRNDENFVQEMGLTLRKLFLDLLDRQNESGND